MQRSGNNSNEDESMFETLKYTKHRLEMHVRGNEDLAAFRRFRKHLAVSVSLQCLRELVLKSQPKDISEPSSSSLLMLRGVGITYRSY